MFFGNLSTDRLILKNIGNDDREFIFNLFSDDDVNMYLFDAEPLTNISGADEIISLNEIFRGKEYFHIIYTLFITKGSKLIE